MAAWKHRARKSPKATAGARCLAWSVAATEAEASSLAAGGDGAAAGSCGVELGVGGGVGGRVGWNNDAGSAVAAIVAVAASLHRAVRRVGTTRMARGKQQHQQSFEKGRALLGAGGAFPLHMVHPLITFVLHKYAEYR